VKENGIEGRKGWEGAWKGESAFRSSACANEVFPEVAGRLCATYGSGGG